MNSKVVSQIGNELINSIKDIFPVRAEVETRIDRTRLSFVCSIYWKLSNDSTRPNKPSKIILISIPCEVIEDLNYKDQKQLIKDKFRKYIENKYKNFNPDHNEPREKSPPNEIWLVTINALL